jgi:hypothetical protein
MFKDWFLAMKAIINAAEVADYLDKDYKCLPRESFNEEYKFQMEGTTKTSTLHVCTENV